MIRHIVWWELKEHAEGHSAAENAWRIEQVSAMLHGLPSLLSVEVSSKIQPSSTVPCQLVLTTTHKTMEDLAEYRTDPVHVQFVSLINAVCSSRNVIDYGFE